MAKGRDRVSVVTQTSGAFVGLVRTKTPAFAGVFGPADDFCFFFLSDSLHPP